MTALSPLLTPEAGERYALRQWLAADAHRLACAIAWGRYSEAEAVREIHSWAAAQVERGKLTLSPAALADAADLVLSDALNARERTDRAALSALVDTAARSLAARATPEQAARAAADAARVRDPLPPPHVVGSAVRIALARAAAPRQRGR